MHVGDWVCIHYEKKDGEVDNNLALTVAILCYNYGKTGIALLWGKEIQDGSNVAYQRVVCTDEYCVVEKESVGGRVVESESCGRVVTENSDGERFSLDRYHVYSTSYRCLAVRNCHSHHIQRVLTFASASNRSLSRRGAVGPPSVSRKK